jgi:hypothetical protein
LIDLVIDAGAERCAAARNRNCVVKTDDVVVRVENGRDDERLVVNVSLVEVDEE